MAVFLFTTSNTVRVSTAGCRVEESAWVCVWVSGGYGKREAPLDNDMIYRNYCIRFYTISERRALHVINVFWVRVCVWKSRQMRLNCALLSK